MRYWCLLFLLAAALSRVGSAEGGDLELTLLPKAGIAPTGGAAAFRATLKNSTGRRLYLNQVSVTFAETEELTVDADEFAETFSAPIEPGAEAQNRPLFSIPVELGTTPGTYHGTAAVLGGEDEEAEENLAQVEFEVKVVKANPLVAAPDQVPVSVRVGETVQGEVEMGNLGTLAALTGITAVVEGAPASLAVQANAPAGLAPMARGTLKLSVRAADESVLQAAPVVRLTSSDGSDAVVRLNITVVPNRPHLVVSPGSLDAGMTRGQQKVVECEVSNQGNVAATGLKVFVPQVPWLSLTTPPTVGTLQPGEKTKLGVLLQPSATQTLGPYTGTLAVNGENAALQIGFRFQCASDGKGRLKVIGEDEYTYFAAGRPRVRGAKVTVKNVHTGEAAAEGETDEDGFFRTGDIPEGFYNLEATAPGRGTHRSVVEVAAGQEREARAFMPRRLVTYTWKVEPVDTPDRYRVDLEVVFETHVPAPVLTVEPRILDLGALSFDPQGRAVVNYIIQNHGLIAANRVRISFDPTPGYTVQALAENIGTLAADTSVVVPVTITKQAGLRTLSMCGSAGRVEGFWECGEIDVSGEAGFPIVYPGCHEIDKLTLWPISREESQDTHVTANEPPQIKVTKKCETCEVASVEATPETVCLGKPVTLTATTSDGSDVTWSGDPDVDGRSGNTITIDFKKAGEKRLTATCGGSGESSKSVTVHVVQLELIEVRTPTHVGDLHTFVSTDEIQINARVTGKPKAAKVRWTVEGRKAAASISGFPTKKDLDIVDDVSSLTFTPSANEKLQDDRKTAYTVGGTDANTPIAFEIRAQLIVDGKEICDPVLLSEAELGTLEQDVNDILRQEYTDFQLKHPNHSIPTPTRNQVGPPNSTPDFPNGSVFNGGNYAVVLNGAMQALAQATRTGFGEAVVVNSAYRNPRRNAPPQTPGQPNSRHMFGDAVDLRPANQGATAVQRRNAFLRLYRAALASGGDDVLLEQGGTPLLPTDYVIPMPSPDHPDEDHDGIPDDLTVNGKNVQAQFGIASHVHIERDP